MPTAATGASIANSNGKRPIQTISNGADDMDELDAMANGKARQNSPPKTHEKSGYQWTRDEDAPGFAWLNKKALDEYGRTWEVLQHKDLGVGNRYGDPIRDRRERAGFECQHVPTLNDKGQGGHEVM